MKTLGACLIVFMLTACDKSKNWTCTCNYAGASASGIQGAGNGTGTKAINNYNQTDAKTICDKFGADLTGTSGTFECNLK